MTPLAHHAGEQALAPLLLLGGSGVTLLLAIGRAHLAATRAKLTRRVRGPEQRPHRRPPPDRPGQAGGTPPYARRGGCRPG